MLEVEGGMGLWWELANFGNGGWEVRGRKKMTEINVGEEWLNVVKVGVFCHFLKGIFVRK